MATLIKTSPKPVNALNIGDQVTFQIECPAQYMGIEVTERVGTIVKINRKTVDVVDRMGNTWRVGMDEVK